MKEEIFSSIRLCASSIGIFSGVYSVAVLLFAMVFAQQSREGSVILDEGGTIRGSKLIAQSFTRPEYFWPRPSAVEYNAAATGGSNLSPANPAIAERATAILSKFEVKDGPRIPADLVTASGSGLDPHITLSAANFQAERVAAARGIPVEAVKAKIESSKDSPTLKVFGAEPLVNVFLLNLALDRRGK